jgi:hypothetical protein
MDKRRKIMTVLTTNHIAAQARKQQKDKTKRNVELRKANVLTYLKTAREQLGQAQDVLAPKTELWNQIGKLDCEVEDIMDELKEGGYDEDSLRVPR